MGCLVLEYYELFVFGFLAWSPVKKEYNFGLHIQSGTIIQGFYVSKIIANSTYEKDDVYVTFNSMYSLYSHHWYEEKL